MRNINKITLLGVLLFMNVSIGTRITGSALQAIPFQLGGMYNKMANEYYQYYNNGYLMGDDLINNFRSFEEHLISNSSSINQSSASATAASATASVSENLSSNTPENEKQQLQNLSTLMTRMQRNINRGQVIWAKKHPLTGNVFPKLSGSTEAFSHYLEECESIIEEKLDHLDTKIRMQGLIDKYKDAYEKMRSTLQDGSAELKHTLQDGSAELKHTLQDMKTVITR